MSPAMDPSSLSGFTRNGMDLDISSACRVTNSARGVCIVSIKRQYACEEREYQAAGGFGKRRVA